MANRTKKGDCKGKNISGCKNGKGKQSGFACLNNINPQLPCIFSMTSEEVLEYLPYAPRLWLQSAVLAQKERAEEMEQ